MGKRKVMHDRRKNASVRDARAKLWELSRAVKVSGVARAGLITAIPRNDDPSIGLGQRESIASNRIEIEREADDAQIRLYSVHNAVEGARQLIELATSFCRCRPVPAPHFRRRNHPASAPPRQSFGAPSRLMNVSFQIAPFAPHFWDHSKCNHLRPFRRTLPNFREHLHILWLPVDSFSPVDSQLRFFRSARSSSGKT